VALLVITSVFIDTTFHDYKRLGYYPAFADNRRFYGYGFFNNSSNYDGNLRTHGLTVEYEETDVVTTDNGDGIATCKGDSGGPLVAVERPSADPSAEVELITGVLSGAQGVSDSHPCASESSSPFVGDNSYFSRVTKSGQDTWIRNTIGHPCVSVSAAGLSAHLRCFDLPFVEDVSFEGSLTAGESTSVVGTTDVTYL
jgi:hypothetical protein